MEVETATIMKITVIFTATAVVVEVRQTFEQTPSPWLRGWWLQERGGAAMPGMLLILDALQTAAVGAD